MGLGIAAGLLGEVAGCLPGKGLTTGPEGGTRSIGGAGCSYGSCTVHADKPRAKVIRVRRTVLCMALLSYWSGVSMVRRWVAWVALDNGAPWPIHSPWVG